MIEPTVVIHIQQDGTYDVMAVGEVRLIWVEDGGEPRVWEDPGRVSLAHIRDIIGDLPIPPTPGRPPSLTVVPEADPLPPAPLVLTIEVANTLCRIGQGEACCRYLTMGGNWSCEKHGTFRKTIDRRVAQGVFTAKGDNCRGMPTP